MDGYLSSIITFDGYPPCNYDFMMPSALLNLLLSVGILLGNFKISLAEKKENRGNRIVAACMGIYRNCQKTRALINDKRGNQLHSRFEVRT